MGNRLLAVGFLMALLALTGCSGQPDSRSAQTETVREPTCSYPSDGQAARPVKPPKTEGVESTGEVKFRVTTNSGDIVITMDRAKTPCTVNSFASLVEQGFYAKTECHRLSDGGFNLLQCGDPTAMGTGGPGYTIPDEVTGQEKYPSGAVAMANRGSPNSGGSQFFLIYGDLKLPPQYTVFGQMDAAGVEVIERIAADGHDNSNSAGGGKPNKPVKIESITKL